MPTQLEEVAYAALTDLPDNEAAAVIARWLTNTDYNVNLILEMVEEEE